MHQPDWAVQSVIQVRGRITSTLEEAEFPVEVQSVLNGMREACRSWLETPPMIVRSQDGRQTPVAIIKLATLRKAFGQAVAALCVAYDLEVDGELAELVTWTAKHSS
jgi:hypothetical protein